MTPRADYANEDVTRYPPYVSVTGNSEMPSQNDSSPYASVTGNAPQYADIGALLKDGFPPAPAPQVLRDNIGVGMFYAGQVNLLFGDPESGKTWVALAAVAEALQLGRKAAVLDLDHNGVQAVVSRLLDLGAPETALTDLERFRYAEPADAAELLAVVRDLSANWIPHVAVVDSMGEVLPLLQASSNSPDDFTRAHGLVLKPLAVAGACVIVIDHLAKNTESRAMGSTGTAAKKRAVGGVSMRVTIQNQFTPGRGGSCTLTIAKDRHGGLRARRSTGDREPLAGTFKLYGDDNTAMWSLFAPTDGQPNPTEQADDALVAKLLNMETPPANVREAREALGCRMEAASKAMAEFKRQRDHAEPVLPRYPHIGAVTGNTPQQCTTCGDPLAQYLIDDGSTQHLNCEES